MNWVDLVVLAVLALSGLIGFMRGLVREVLGIGAWVAAVLVAMNYYAPAQAIARRYIANPDIANPLAFAVLFLVVLLLLSIIAGWIGRVVRGSPLGGLDRSLGVVFGLLRGAALAVAVYIGGGMLIPVERWPPPVLQARGLPYIYNGARWAAAQLPPTYRPRVEPPPQGPETKAALLLQATPSGRARAVPAARN
jgi:membrane protein required for colicin V production